MMLGPAAVESEAPPADVKGGIMARKRSNPLSPPTQVTWWVASILGALGIVGKLTPVPVISTYAYWLVAVAFVIFALATRIKGA
jgi:hypothetical protein